MNNNFNKIVTHSSGNEKTRQIIWVEITFGQTETISSQWYRERNPAELHFLQVLQLRYYKSFYIKTPTFEITFLDC